MLTVSDLKYSLRFSGGVGQQNRQHVTHNPGIDRLHLDVLKIKHKERICNTEHADIDKLQLSQTIHSCNVILNMMAV